MLSTPEALAGLGILPNPASNGPQALSRCGLTTRLDTDARGRPVHLYLNAGQRHDAPQALPLLEGWLRPTSLPIETTIPTRSWWP